MNQHPPEWHARGDLMMAPTRQLALNALFYLRRAAEAAETLCEPVPGDVLAEIKSAVQALETCRKDAA